MPSKMSRKNEGEIKTLLGQKQKSWESLSFLDLPHKKYYRKFFKLKWKEAKQQHEGIWEDKIHW